MPSNDSPASMTIALAKLTLAWTRGAETQFVRHDVPRQHPAIALPQRPRGLDVFLRPLRQDHTEREPGDARRV